MRKKFVTDFLIFIFAEALGVITLLRFAEDGTLPAGKALMLSLLFTAVCAFVTVAVALRQSVKVTVYSYKNIALVGCMAFLIISFGILCYSALPLVWGGDITPAELYRTLLAVPRRFCLVATVIILAVSVAVGISNIELIRKEGFRPTNALSVLVAALYVGGAAVLFFVSDVIKSFADRQGKAVAVICSAVILFAILFLCYFECILIGSAVMGLVAVRRKPDCNKDFIIILGCSIDKKGGLLPLLKGRVNRAMRFAWEQEIATGKPLKYVPSGGQGANEIMSEGSAMELYLLSKGAESNEVFPEKASATTLENMKFSKAIIDAELADAKIAFATTNYHVLRSGILAREAGFDAEGIAGDTKWYFWPNGFVREFFAILAMKRAAHLQVAAILATVCAVITCIGLFL